MDLNLLAGTRTGIKTKMAQALAAAPLKTNALFIGLCCNYAEKCGRSMETAKYIAKINDELGETVDFVALAKDVNRELFCFSHTLEYWGEVEEYHTEPAEGKEYDEEVTRHGEAEAEEKAGKLREEVAAIIPCLCALFGVFAVFNLFAFAITGGATGEMPEQTENADTAAE